MAEACVFTGAGEKAFCAGGDLKMFKTVFQEGADRDDIVRFNADFGRLMKAIQTMPQLFIVLIEGAAMAGGLGLACLADVVVTTRDARYALTEVTLGIPPAQITPVVIKRIGASEARRLLLTAATFDGEEAFNLGFAHFVVDDAAALEKKARQEGFGEARLETGIHQRAAIKLYEKRGYEKIEPFGSYKEDPLSVFMRKKL